MTATYYISRAIAGICIIAAIVIATLDPFSMGPPSAALALTIAVVSMWATGVIAEHVGALFFFTVAMLFSIAPAEVTFSGFEAGATWLIFGGLIIGVGVNESGLGERMATKLTNVLGQAYNRIILGILLFCLILGFVMPSSMGRIVLIAPIAMALAKELGYVKDSSGYIGIILAAAFGSFFLPYGILPANIPNVVLLGLVEGLYNYTPTYGEWLALHFPVISLAKVLILWALILWLFPAPNTPTKERKATAPISTTELKLAVILGLALLGWATDFIHGISPAWIGMAAGLLCMTPGIGNVMRKEFAKINFTVVFFVTAILGIGAMINHSGLGTIIANIMIDIVPLEPGQTFQNFMTIALTGVVAGSMTTVAGVPVLLTPIAEQLSEASGFSLKAVLMLQALSFSTPFLIYQAVPIVVAMHLADIRLKDATKLILALAVVTIALLFPLNYLWWQLLGWI